MDGIIAAACRVRGYHPVVLTEQSFSLAKRYFRACGVTSFIDFDERIREARPTSIDHFLESSKTFASLFTLTHEGVDVGRHVLSSVVRALKQGSVSFNDPAVHQNIRRILPQSFAAIDTAKKIFDDVKPTLVLFLERGYSPFGELFDVALLRNLNVVQYHHAHRSDLIVLTRYSYDMRHRHSFSILPSTFEKILAMPWSQKDERQFMESLQKSYEDGTWFNRKFLLKDKKTKSADEIRTQLKLDPQKKTAVIFSHVLWDATFFFGESLFPDYEQWLVATVKAACENPRVNWIVKLHPDYMWKTRDGASPRDVFAIDAAIGELPSHVTIVPPNTDINTYSFFQMIDYCVTVRGTVGIEAPCFGIPVFTAGTGRYSDLGFTNDSSSQEEYLEKMRRIEEYPRLSPEEMTRARRHAFALFNLRPFAMHSFEMAPIKRHDAFDHELIVRVNSVDALRHADDLTTFADWILHAKENDYLRAEPLP
jgi:hypothetical protein